LLIGVGFHGLPFPHSRDCRVKALEVD
jgi:hypothetical protein